MLQDIFVTNNNDFTHIDAFDGAEYVFPPKERVSVPAEAATHMLGFNLKDKTETLVRLGWASKPDVKMGWIDDPEGPKKLARFAFTRAVLVEESVTSAETPLV